jgi:hypothetical protein
MKLKKLTVTVNGRVFKCPPMTAEERKEFLIELIQFCKGQAVTVKSTDSDGDVTSDYVVKGNTND